MKSQYHIDLEKFTLDKFKQSLKQREMIPSRVILKEEIDQRFNVLSANGINNLKNLVDALKTKVKVESFSRQTDLTIEYLTILKREANSYLPNPKKLKDFTGIDENDIQALENIGIKNSKQLFNKINIEMSVDQLSEQTGVSEDKLKELAALSDLVRIYGVGPAFARIIYDVGIDSLEAFVQCSAEDFIHIYEEKTGKKADFGVNDINFSLEVAKELKRIYTL